MCEANNWQEHTQNRITEQIRRRSTQRATPPVRAHTVSKSTTGVQANQEQAKIRGEHLLEQQKNWCKRTGGRSTFREGAHPGPRHTRSKYTWSMTHQRAGAHPVHEHTMSRNKLDHEHIPYLRTSEATTLRAGAQPEQEHTRFVSTT